MKEKNNKTKKYNVSPKLNMTDSMRKRLEKKIKNKEAHETLHKRTLSIYQDVNEKAKVYEKKINDLEDLTRSVFSRKSFTQKKKSPSLSDSQIKKIMDEKNELMEKLNKENSLEKRKLAIHRTNKKKKTIKKSK